DVGWRNAAMVCAGCCIAAVRRGRYPHHAGISGDEMGIRAGDRVYRRGRCVPLRPWLPRATARAARTLHSHALATGARIDNALRRRRRRRHPCRCGAFKVPTISEHHRGDRRIRPRLRLWLDGFSGAVHARHGWRLLSPRIEKYIRTRVAVDEFPDDGNVADRDDPEEIRTI